MLGCQWISRRMGWAAECGKKWWGGDLPTIEAVANG